MRVIGLTGGMGTGKSQAASILNELGAYIIDADIISREVVKKGTSTLENLSRCFGMEILDNNGDLDRKKLAEIVFNYPEKLEKLNDIVHKEVFKLIKQKIKNLKEKEFNGILVLDVPIPTKEFKKLSDQIWVVDADLDKRISRIKKRSGLSIEEIEKRINAQLSRKEYLGIADKVIANNGTIDELRNTIEKLFFEEREKTKSIDILGPTNH